MHDTRKLSKTDSYTFVTDTNFAKTTLHRSPSFMAKTLRDSPFNDEDLSIDIQNIPIDSTFSSIMMDSFFDILTLFKGSKKIF